MDFTDLGNRFTVSVDDQSGVWTLVWEVRAAAGHAHTRTHAGCCRPAEQVWPPIDLKKLPVLMITAPASLAAPYMQYLKKRVPLRQAAFKNKFGVLATVDELPVQ